MIKNLSEATAEPNLAGKANLIRHKALLISYFGKAVTREEEIENIAEFLKKRVEFLDRVWINGEDLINIFIRESDENGAAIYANYAVPRGTVPASVIEKEGTLYIEDGSSPADLTKPVNDSVIYCRKPHSPDP